LEGYKAGPFLYAQCLLPRGRKETAGQRREFSSSGYPMVLEVHLEFFDTSDGEKFCVESVQRYPSNKGKPTQERGSDGSSLSVLSDQSGNPPPCPVVVPLSGSCLAGELLKGTEAVPRARG